MRINQDASDYVAKGNSAFEESRYDAAIFYYNQALEAEPGQAFVLRNKGKSLNELGQYREAIECFDEALGVDPDDVDTWIDRGYAYFQILDYDAALTCLDKAWGLDEHEPLVWRNRAAALSQLDRNAEAIESLETALKLTPEDVGTLNMMAWVHYNAGELGRAKSRYEEVLRVSNKLISGAPQNPEVWAAKGDSLRGIGRYSEAEECYHKAIDLEPNNADLLSSLSNLYSDQLYNFEKGTEFAFMALENTPEAGAYSFKMDYAEALLKSGKYEVAKDKLLELSGQEAGADSLTECVRSFLLLCCDCLLHQSSDGFNDFLGRLEGLGEEFEIQEKRWVFRGVTESIRTGDGDPMTRFLLLTLIDIMQARLRRRDFRFFGDDWGRNSEVVQK